MALAVADIRCELREVLLRDKPAEMLQASPKGTVPVVVLSDRTIDESLEVMHWALDQRDPDSWRAGPQDEARTLVRDNDGPFKHHLDRYKYAARYSDAHALQERDHAATFIAELETRLAKNTYLTGERPRLVDVAVFPFVRQFASVDPGYWKNGLFGNTERWLERWLASKLFARCMHKSSPWSPEDEPVFFPALP